MHTTDRISEELGDRKMDDGICIVPDRYRSLQSEVEFFPDAVSAIPASSSFVARKQIPCETALDFRVKKRKTCQTRQLSSSQNVYGVQDMRRTPPAAGAQGCQTLIPVTVMGHTT